MFNSRTVFIVGAGASKEAGLPIGRELKPKISECIDIRFGDGSFEQESGDRDIMAALQAHVSNRSRREKRDINVGEYLYAGSRIRDAMPQASSIDTFVDAHEGDEAIELCGKLAIAKTILDAERSSSMYFDQRRPQDRLPFERLEDTWFTRLFQALTTGCRRNRIDSVFDQIAIITFNYDRCIEHFLYHSLQNFYSVTSGVAEELLKSLCVFHPYGQVGWLPWQDSSPKVPFGASTNGSDLLKIVPQIKTFTEQVDDQKSLGDMQDIIATARQLVFLGFAFHEQNMELLRPSMDPEVHRVLATGKGLSDSDCSIIRSEITKQYEVFPSDGPDIDLRNNLTCCGLFDEFSRTLMA